MRHDIAEHSVDGKIGVLADGMRIVVVRIEPIVISIRQNDVVIQNDLPDQVVDTAGLNIIEDSRVGL